VDDSSQHQQQQQQQQEQQQQYLPLMLVLHQLQWLQTALGWASSI